MIDSLKKFILVCCLCLGPAAIAFAGTYAELDVTVNVGDSSFISIWGLSGSMSTTLSFVSAVTQSVSNQYTDLAYSTNLAAWKLEILNVTTDNPVYVDGVMRGDAVNVQLPLWVNVLPWDGVMSPPSATDPNWRSVYDSQRTTANHVIITGSAPSFDSDRRELYYKTDYTAGSAGKYSAVLQYQLSMQ